MAIVSARHPTRPVIYVNRSFAEGTGYAAAECFARPCLFLDGPATDRAMSRRVHQALAAGTGLTVELAAYRKDGSFFTDRLTIEPVHDEAGDLLAFVCTHQDVTAVRAGEQSAVDRDRIGSLGLLAGQVAHELNNLLQPIVSFTSLLRDDPRLEAADVQEDLACILDHARHAREIVSNILKFSRKDPSPLTRISLAKAMGDSLALVAPLLPPSVELRPRIDPAVGAAAINRTELTQVLTNLAINAVQAMQGNGVLSITLAREYLDQARAAQLRIPTGDYAVLCVADTGCGMDEETRARIFDPFFTTKPVGSGTGLGLSVVYGIVRGWAGGIAVESKPGEGARFTVTVPLAN
jgi:PAS domain S-box-containing protein